MRSPSHLALLSFCLLPFLSACAQEEPLLEAKPALGSAAEPLSLRCMNGTACTDTKGSCTGTGTCNAAGICVVSTWCDDNNGCTVDSCFHRPGGNNYVCRNAAAPKATPCNDNTACTIGDHCNGAGACIGGTTLNCDDTNPCTTDGCNKVLGCMHGNVAAGVSCSDNNACTASDACDGSGQCTGSTVVCDDGDSCTNDSCNIATGCVFSFKGNKATCNDGDKCTTGDRCNSHHQCVGRPIFAPDDGNACTLDQCDPATGSIVHPNNDGASCSDNDACTVSDTCINGGCSGATLDCDDNNVCTTDSCNSSSGCQYKSAGPGVSCDDSNACTTGDHCSHGGCRGTKVHPVNDNNACTRDVCNSTTGETDHLPVTNGLACSDNRLCTQNDSCQAGVCKGADKICDDNSKCTNDHCEPTTGECTYQFQCNGNACAISSCDPVVGCSAKPINCDDSDPCTTDACAVPGGCQHQACNDGDACTNDVCDPGKGCKTSPIDCADNDLCTVDSCDLTLGCQHAAITCPDGNACLIASCNPQSGCSYAPKVVDDHNSCTNDTCNIAAGPGNIYIGDGEPCDDGVATTQEDFCGENKCNPGLSCQPAVLTTLPQPVPPTIVRRRLGRGRHVVATSDKGQAVVFVEELTGNGGSVSVGVATFAASGARAGVVKWGNVPFYADPVIAALPSGDYVVAFDSISLDGDGLAVGLVKVSSDGQLLTQPILANTTKVFGQHSADIIWTGTELRMAWEDESEPGHRRLCERRFKADLSPITGEECGASAPEYDRSRVSLTTVGQTPVTAWQETWQETFEPFNTRRRVQLRVGAAQTSFDITAAPQDESPALAELDESHVLMVYPDTDGTQRAVVVNSAGAVVDNAALNEPGEPRYTPVLTKIGEQVYMAWMSPPALLDGGWDPDLDDVFAQKLAWNLNVLDLDANAKFPISFSESYGFGDQRNPAIVARLFSGKNAMWAAWEDFRDDKTQTSHGDVLVSIRVLP